MASPARDRKKRNARTQKSAKNKSNPVGTVTPKTVNARNPLRTLPKLPPSVSVYLSPCPPIAKTSAGFLNGAISQKMHIAETTEKPT
jgi:hypothetical protein